MNNSKHSIPDDSTISEFDDFAASDFDGDFELTCPGCDCLLSGDSFYEQFRVCPRCHRHFWLSSRERVGIVADRDSFRETNSTVVSVEPLVFQDPLPIVDPSATWLSAGETVLTGQVRIDGRDAILVVVDMAMTPGGIGIVAGERICLAFEDAAHRRIPLVVFSSGGTMADHENLLTLAQSIRIASVVGRLQRNGVPFISVMTHPATGIFFTGIGNQANLIFAEPAAQLGMGSARPHGTTDREMLASEAMLAAGMIDGIIERPSLCEQLITMLDLFTSRGVPRASASPVWENIPRGRGNDDPELSVELTRPDPGIYLETILENLVEIHGDRSGISDPSLIAGFGQIEGVTVGLLGTGRAPLTAAGLRTVVRLYRLAGQFEIPVVTLIDSPAGADISAIEGAARSHAIAQTMRVAISLPIPTIAIVTGTASSLGALALTVADRVYMLEHALFANGGTGNLVPPGLASSSTNSCWGARESLRLGIVDGIIPEPAGGAHVDPDAAAQQLKLTIIHALAELNGIGQRRLLEERSRKHRYLGLATPAGQEALHIEITQLRDLQQSLERSIDELRDRLELHQLGLPNLPSLPRRPANMQLPQLDLSSLPVRPSLPTIRRPGLGRTDVSQFAERLAATRRGLTERVHEMRATLDDTDQSRPKEPPHHD